MSIAASQTSRVAERFLRRRRPFEAGYWLVSGAMAAVGNTATARIDAARAGLDVAPWEVATWEVSSAVAWLLLIPVVAVFTARWPVHLDNWLRRVPFYALASVAWSVLHVGLMVGMRRLVYGWHGESYVFGQAFVYEYMKDARTFLGLVVVMHLYRALVRRLQGEASLLTAPDDDSPPVEPVERPARFLVRKLGREFLVAADDIERVQAAGNYADLHVRGKTYPLRTTLTELEARLDPDRFLRVHRSHMVNVTCVASIEPLDSGDARVHLDDGSVVPCSRRYRDQLRAAVR